MFTEKFVAILFAKLVCILVEVEKNIANPSSQVDRLNFPSENSKHSDVLLHYFIFRDSVFLGLL